MTDGAKAWTLDGYIPSPRDSADIIPNELTGSNIDIQLAEDPIERRVGNDVALQVDPQGHGLRAG